MDGATTFRDSQISENCMKLKKMGPWGMVESVKCGTSEMSISPNCYRRFQLMAWLVPVHSKVDSFMILFFSLNRSLTNDSKNVLNIILY